VVVAWNGGETLERCVESLRGQGVNPIVLVDNGSRRSERQRLEKLYGGLSDLHLVLLPENTGFARGANLGAQAALGSGADEVLLATQDVVAEPGAVAHLSEALRSQDAGIAGPLVLDRDGRREISRGERLIPALLCLPRTLLRHRRQAPGAYAVSGVMGCLMLLRAEVLRLTGGFDERFFAYYEEVDLCLRARAAGFRIVCVPAARVRHEGMRGFAAGMTALAAELKARNLIWTMRKHGTPLRWLLFVPSYLALVGASIALYAARGRLDVAAALCRGAAAGAGMTTLEPPDDAA
jgi:GT2 family glycosyltransferase